MIIYDLLLGFRALSPTKQKPNLRLASARPWTPRSFSLSSYEPRASTGNPRKERVMMLIKTTIKIPFIH